MAMLYPARKPIYVELEIASDMESLWTYTQQPELHEQWDLRFSSITYLPRHSDNHSQPFHYETRIGFGLRIEGTGIARTTEPIHANNRLSTLSFRSDQAVSLIRQGGGYWKYEQLQDGVLFHTQYDYQTRFGIIGAWFDRWLFRPLFGYATAWSFDSLRIWLEKGVLPSVTLRWAALHYVSTGWLALLWIIQGLIPKLLFPEAGELRLLQQLGWFHGLESYVLIILGLAEIAIGVGALVWHRKGWFTAVQIVLLSGLAAVGLLSNPELLKAPFNPLLLSGSMIGSGLVVYMSKRNLPKAAHCKREPGDSSDRRRVEDFE